LASYGRQEDADIFCKALKGMGFDVTTDACRVDRPTFKARLCELSAAACEKDDVFVLVFSGHGQQELLTRHASLVFSDNKTVSSYSLDHLLAPAAKASVYTILNCCTATGVPLVVPYGTLLSSVAGQAAVDIATAGGVEATMAGKRRVEVFSTSHVEEQKAAKKGTLFARAFDKVMQGGKAPLLESFEEDLTTQMTILGNHTGEVPTTVKVVRYSFVGMAFFPLQEETKVRHPMRLTHKSMLFDPCDFNY
jgi:hypothetical protein